MNIPDWVVFVLLVIPVGIIATHKVVRLGKSESGFLFENDKFFKRYRGEIKGKGLYFVRRWWTVDKLECSPDDSAAGVVHEFTHQFTTRDRLPYKLTFYVRGRAESVPQKAREGGRWRNRYIGNHVINVFEEYISRYSLEELLYKSGFDTMASDAALEFETKAEGDFLLEVIELTDPVKRDTEYHRRFHFSDLAMMRHSGVIHETDMENG